MNRFALPILFDEISKSFGPVQALQSTTLEIRAGEFITMLGPSGSGKTTLLNIAAGYISPDNGKVLIGGRDITAVPPRKRNVGMVFQNYALFPHLTVFENVAYGLRVRKVHGKEVHRRVNEVLEMLELGGFGGRHINQLSGGQQQRVALARALVFEPDVLLMDEPLGALDRQLRKHVQLEIRRLHRKIQRTTLYVTHDQEEALVMSDRIGVMNAGNIEQIGAPKELYERPENDFVASFLGESNIFLGKYINFVEDLGRIEIESLKKVFEGRANKKISLNDEVVAMIRPEAVNVVSDVESGVPAKLEEIVYLGELVSLKLRLSNGQEVWSRKLAKDGYPTTENVGLVWNWEDVLILPLATKHSKERR